MQKIVERTAEILKKQGVESFDVYAVEVLGFSAEAKDGETERIAFSSRRGVAIRVVVGGKMGFSYTCDVSDDSIRVSIECARESAKMASPDEYSFSVPSQSPWKPRFDTGFLEIPREEKIQLALELDARARGYDERIKRVRKAVYRDAISNVFYLNSNDQAFSYTTTSFSLSILAVAEEDGDSRMGWDLQTARYFSDLNPSAVATRACESAINLLGAKRIKTRKIPVILKDVIFAEFIEGFYPAFCGDNVVRGKTPFAGMIGRNIASPALSIYDDPTREEGTGYAPFDDEGTVTRKKAIVDRGILRNYLLDLYSARKLGMEPTGNGMRSSLSSPPKAGITNLVVEEGSLSLEELLRIPEEVLLVTDVMGTHTVNPITGEFSVGVSGLLFKNGKLAERVSGVTIAGNLQDLLKSVVEVGKDSRWMGRICSPSVLIESLTIGGD